MIRVVAQRDDLLMIADPDAGPGAILHRPGTEPRVVHIDTAFAAGYWVDSTDPMPPLPDAVVAQLRDFNTRWATQHRP